MEFLFEYGLFLAQAATVVIAILVVIAVAVSLGHKQRPGHEGHIEIHNLNEKYEQIGDSIREVVDDPERLKADLKAKKKADKAKAKENRKLAKKGEEQKAEEQRKRLFGVAADPAVLNGYAEVQVGHPEIQADIRVRRYGAPA